MKDDDVLIIGNGLNNKNFEEIMTSYNDNFVDNWLTKILIQIGLKKDNLQF
jgi:hypothetical protein